MGHFRPKQWGHAEGEEKAGKMLSLRTVPDPSTRLMTAIPKLGFGSAANEAGSFAIKDFFPSG